MKIGVFSCFYSVQNVRFTAPPFPVQYGTMGGCMFSKWRDSRPPLEKHENRGVFHGLEGENDGLRGQTDHSETCTVRHDARNRSSHVT